MKRLSRVRMNPCSGRWIKPAGEITDRAKRYRANAVLEAMGGPVRCGFCGSTRYLTAHHIDGIEDDSSPGNLMWACKSCNTNIGHRMKRAGLGRRVRQYNPRRGRRRADLEAYGAAIKVMRGVFDGDVGAAMKTIRETPPDVRSAYTARTWATRRAVYGPSGRAESGNLEIPF